MELHILVGFPFSGKSRYYENILKPNLPEDHIRLNPGEIKKLLRDSGVDKEKINDLTFKVLLDRIRKNLKNNKCVVFDALNLTKRERRKLIEEGKKHNSKIIAHVINPPLKVCLKRNEELGGIIPEERIKTLYKNFEIPTKKEGFNKIIIVNWKQVDFKPQVG